MYIQSPTPDDLREIKYYLNSALPPNSPRHIRRDVNPDRWMFLKMLSNPAIACLAVMHGQQMALKELRLRLKDQQFGYRQLFMLAEMLCHQTHYRRAANRMAKEVHRQIIDLTPKTSRIEVLEMLLLYRQSKLQYDWKITAKILSHRADHVAVLRALDECH
ncbi:MAG: hypothetical protein V1738_05920 [Patescibacteria group bacterium]